MSIAVTNVEMAVSVIMQITTSPFSKSLDSLEHFSKRTVK